MSEQDELKFDQVSVSSPVRASKIVTVLLAATEIIPRLQLTVFHPLFQKKPQVKIMQKYFMCFHRCEDFSRQTVSNICIISTGI